MVLDDGTSHSGSDDEDSADERIFTCQVTKTEEQEESVTTSDGFEV